MFDQINDYLVATIKTNPWLAPFAALVGGLLTAANPCVITMVPLMMAYVAGEQENRTVLRAVFLSLVFTLGLTFVFLLLFLFAVGLSSLVPEQVWSYIAAIVCLLMGLHLLGVLELNIPTPPGMKPSYRGVIGALMLGTLFGVISLPCAGPILVVLLSFVGTKGVMFTGSLLTAYSLGHCALIIVAGTSMGVAQRLIESQNLRSANVWLKRVAGFVVFSVGLLILFS